MTDEEIVAALEQLPGAEEYLAWVNQGTPAQEAWAAYHFDKGVARPDQAHFDEWEREYSSREIR